MEGCRLFVYLAQALFLSHGNLSSRQLYPPLLNKSTCKGAYYCLGQEPPEPNWFIIPVCLLWTYPFPAVTFTSKHMGVDYSSVFSSDFSEGFHPQWSPENQYWGILLTLALCINGSWRKVFGISLIIFKSGFIIARIYNKHPVSADESFITIHFPVIRPHAFHQQWRHDLVSTIVYMPHPFPKKVAPLYYQGTLSTLSEYLDFHQVF